MFPQRELGWCHAFLCSPASLLNVPFKALNNIWFGEFSVKNSTDLEGFPVLVFHSDLITTGEMLQGTEEFRVKFHVCCFCCKGRFGNGSWKSHHVSRVCLSGFVSGKPGVRLGWSIQWYDFPHMECQFQTFAPSCPSFIVGPHTAVTAPLSWSHHEQYQHSQGGSKVITMNLRGSKFITMKLRGSRKRGKNVLNCLYFWQKSIRELYPWEFSKERLMNVSVAEGRIS